MQSTVLNKNIEYPTKYELFKNKLEKRFVDLFHRIYVQDLGFQWKTLVVSHRKMSHGTFRALFRSYPFFNVFRKLKEAATILPLPPLFVMNHRRWYIHRLNWQRLLSKVFRVYSKGNEFL
ncbi:hypothetical protein ANTPLA_LOCUS7802 [Anthophora plagiata]